MGGSQGAKWINDMVRECLDTILLNFNIIHICGKGRPIYWHGGIYAI